MEENSTKVYDLLVTGAGIYGAWAAYDATLRGLKVLVVDKGDIGSGTSSASSKLIHGGLRYLEHFNFGLVKKSLIEREKLLRLGPHRIEPLRFAIPVYKKTRVPFWKYKVGLTLYDFLSHTKKENKHQSFNGQIFKEKFPFLKAENLLKGLTYLDARTDDFRYTFEIVDGAIQAGAEVKTYCEIKKYKINQNESSEALILNKLTQKEEKVFFRAAINATGQWTSEILDLVDYRLSKGVHIILPDLKLTEALLLLTPQDQRVFFIIPWYGKTLVGTTDTDFKGDINQLKAEKEDIDYLLNAVNHYLKSTFSHEEVISSFAGLRVLKNENGLPSSVTRDWECREIKPGFYASLGGKLTSARQESVIMVNKVCEFLGIKIKSSTEHSPLPWSVNNFLNWKEKIITKGIELGLTEEIIILLIQRQGIRVEKILKMIEENRELKNPLFNDLPFCLAEWHFVLEHERVKTFNDLIRRRFPLLLLKKFSSEELFELEENANQILLQLGKTPLRNFNAP